jgi:hypothetical protein
MNMISVAMDMDTMTIDMVTVSMDMVAVTMNMVITCLHRGYPGYEYDQCGHGYGHHDYRYGYCKYGYDRSDIWSSHPFILVMKVMVRISIISVVKNGVK